MPLSAAVPVIDDRRYDDIVAEIRARIPRYTPEWTPDAEPLWTDLNDSDPGITLAQLFAWLSEMMLYRMGRVPELNYIKFLELIGIELAAAQPAYAELSFAVEDTWPAATVSVPRRTQVSATAEDGPPIVFETERPLTAVACRLASVQAYDGAAYRDASEANASGQVSFLPFGEVARDGAALVLGLGFPPGHPNENDFPALSLDLAVWTDDPPGAPRALRCDATTTRAYAPARLAWEAFDGNDWQPCEAFNDETLAFTRSGHVVVRVPATAKPGRAFLGTYDSLDPVTGAARPPLFWLRARLTRTQYERTPKLRAVRTNTVPAVQAQTVEREILGGSTGARNQAFKLENAPVRKGSVRIQIDDGTGAREWTNVDDFFGSGPRDEVFVVNWTTGEVIFGDGENGAIPVANANDPDANVVALEYRFGGGKEGNLAAGKIRTLQTPVAGIDAGQATNLYAAYAGRDEETLDEAKKRARRQLRARDRAVSVEDFEQLATEAGNVKRAKALPLAHPQFPGVAIPGVVTVIVVPDADADPPTPSEGLLRTVCEYLDARRLLTTELYVVAPKYVTVEIDATIVVTDDAEPSGVHDAVIEALRAYLHPLRGGDDGGGWPFGGTIRYSKLVQRAFAVPGVDSVDSLVVTLEGEPQPECADIRIDTLAPTALPNLTSLAVEAVTLREAEDMSP